MPLKILYLLADPGIGLTESRKGASIHVRSILSAMRQDLHEVTVVFMRQGNKGDLGRDCRLIKPEPGGLTLWFEQLFIDSYVLEGRLLGLSFLGFVGRIVFFTVMLAAAVLLLANAWRNLGDETASFWTPAFAALAVLGAGFPLNNTWKHKWKDMKRDWKKKHKITRSIDVKIPSLISAIYNLLQQRDFYRAALDEVEQQGRPDVIYARDAWFAFPYHRLAKKIRRPLVLEVNAIAWREKDLHGDGALRALSKGIERRNLEAADLILPVSEAMRQQAIECGARPEATITTPNGTDVERFHTTSDIPRFPAFQERFVVGLVSSMKPYHGVDLLIEAAEILRDDIPNLAVWVIGGGPEYERMVELAVQKGLEDTVLFEGTKPYELLPVDLAQFDVAVAPYHGEKQAYMSPLKVYEYMAAQCPMVCANWGELAKLLDDGETALLHEPGNAKDLAAKILRLRNDPDLARRLAENAFPLVENRSWLNIARGIFTQLEQWKLIAPGWQEIDETDSRAIGLRKEQERERRETELQQQAYIPRLFHSQSWDLHVRRRDAFLNGAATDATPGRKAETDSGAHGPAAGPAEGLPLKPERTYELEPPVIRKAKGLIARAVYNQRSKALCKRALWLERRMPPPSRPADRPLRVMRLASSASVGGVAKVMNQTILRFDPKQIETTVLLFGSPDHVSPRLTEAPGLHFISRQMELAFMSWDWDVFRNIKELVKIINRERPDILHLHEPQYAPAVRAAAAQAGVPLTVQLHSAYSERRTSAHSIQRRLERKALRDLPLIAHAQGVADDAYRYIGQGVSRWNKEIFLTEDGVDDLALWGDHSQVDQWIEQQAGDKKILLLIGKMVPLKRIPDFIHACRILIDEGQDVFAIVVTYDPLKSKFRKQMTRHFQRVFKPGEAELLLNIASPVDLIKRAHVAVSCSEVEGLPKTLLEYMDNGLPVVCSDIVAHRELVEHEETGLLFKLDDMPSMLRELRRLLADEPFRQKLIANARESVAKRRWARTASQVMDIYRTVLTPRSGRGTSG